MQQSPRRVISGRARFKPTPLMPTELLTERPNAHTLVLTISDPATRNALSPQVYAAGIEALASAEADDQVRCVIVRGAGEHFCGGGDLNRLRATRELGFAEGQARQRQSIGQLGELMEALATLPKPVVAAVEGFAAGAGFSLAVACDLVVAASEAKFVASYARVGLSPDGGLTWQLARKMGTGRALQALLLAEPITAEDAHTMGWVNVVAPKGQALAAAMALADRLAKTAPNVVASAKELLHGATQANLHDQLHAEGDHFVSNLFHGNGGEGIAAFLEKRVATFR
jgi:enoyl-CoA hydratase/carnithine racemase